MIFKNGGDEMKEVNPGIIKLIQKFEAGYKSRNQEILSDYMNSVFASNVEITAIGTSAVSTDSDEWCIGYEAVSKLIADDWLYWGELTLDFTQLYSDQVNDSAFVSICGTVYEKMTTDSYNKFRLSLVNDVIKRDDLDDKTKLIEILSGISNTLMETNKGDDYFWPVRITGYLIRENENWKFKHIHFSYPIEFYPQVRK